MRVRKVQERKTAGRETQEKTQEKTSISLQRCEVVHILLEKSFLVCILLLRFRCFECIFFAFREKKFFTLNTICTLKLFEGSNLSTKG